MLIEMIKESLESNGNRLKPEFIEGLIVDVKHTKLSETSRVCLLQCVGGLEIIGKAQVLDTKNNDDLKGQEVAYKDALSNLYQDIGSISKAILAK